MHVYDRPHRRAQPFRFGGVVQSESIGRVPLRLRISRRHAAIVVPLISPRIHLAHDWLVGLRGGEWVLDRLARMYGPTTLYTLVDDEQPLSPAIDACEKRVSFLQVLPGGNGALRRWYLPLYPLAVSMMRTQPCDLIISTSSAVMKSIRPPEGVPHLCYCHSPARYLWGQEDDYAHGSGGGLRSFGLRMMRKRFREWDRATADRVTTFLANSQHTAERIRTAYDREAEVVYPPVRTEFFTPNASVKREDWLLIVGALEPYKRPDLVVELARRTGLSVKVAGRGSLERSLKEAAPPNVEFLGRVDDEELRDLYRRARALVFPQQEDFGIIAVEAQACGCPVIAYRRGGAMESITEETGAFFDEQTVEALEAAVTQFDASSIEAAACRANAERFAEAVFDAAIRAQVDKLLESRRARLSPSSAGASPAPRR